MKKTFTLLAFLFISITNAQISEGVSKAAAGEVSKLTSITSFKGAGTATMVFFNPPRQVDGSEYLFDDWNNFAVIYTEGNQKFSLRNINLNITQNAFVSKVDGDSLFTFNFNNIRKVNINGKNYKNYYWNDDNRVYEIIYEGDGFSILKGFKIVEITGSANPMLNRSRDRLVRKHFYYLKTDKGIKPFQLKKKKILKLVNGDAVEAAKIQEYAKNNKLSFKKERDVRQILDYSARN